MNDALAEILHDAQASGRLNLLNVLHSYKKVTEKLNILDYSEEGVEIYKTLLHWGRERNPNWDEKYTLFFPKNDEKLLIQDLEIPSKTQMPALTLKFSSGDNSFQVSLPSFKSFQQKFKESSPKHTLAQALNTSHLKKKAWKYWVYFFQASKAEKLNTRKMQDKAVKSLKAHKLWSDNTKRKTIQRLSKNNLYELRKMIAGKMHCELLQKKMWKFWRNALKKREILKGMKFTACFIHNQWLMKKVFLVLARNVHNSMVILIKKRQIIQMVENNKKILSMQGWRIYVNSRLKKKILYLKSHHIKEKFFKARGLKKWQLGIEVLKDDNMQNSLCRAHYCQKTSIKVFNCWLRFMIENSRQTLKMEQADQFFKISLIKNIFTEYKLMIVKLKEIRSKKLNYVQLKKKKSLFEAWKVVHSQTKIPQVNSRYIFLAYYAFIYPHKSLDFPRKVFGRKKRLNLSEKILQEYIKKNLFICWRDHIKIFVEKKHKIFISRVQKNFSSWKFTAHKRQMHKYIILKLKTCRNKKKTHKIFTSWASTYLKISENKRKYKQYCTQKRQIRITTVCTKWLTKTITKIRHKKENVLIPVFYRQTFLSKYLKKWVKKFKRMQRKHELQHRGQRFLLDLRMKKNWNIWRKRFLENLRIEYKTGKVQNLYENKLVIKCFKAWKVRNARKINSGAGKRKAEEQLEYVRKVKSIFGWKQFFSYSKSKKSLYAQLESDRGKSLSKKILNYWQIYAQYRIKSKNRDQITYSALYMIRKKYLLNRWYNKALLLSSMRYFENIFNNLQKKQVIFQIHRFIEMQKVTLAYLEIFREEARVKTAFSAWRRILRKKKLLIRRAQEFTKIKKKFAKIKPFMAWTRQYEKAKQKVKKFADILVESGNFEKKSRFFLWKKRVIRKNQHRESYFHRGNYLKKICYCVLKCLLSKKNINASLAQDLLQKKKVITCRKIIKGWRKVNKISIRNKNIIANAQKNRIKKFLQFWATFAEERIIIKEKVMKVKKICEKQKKIRVLKELKNFIQYKNEIKNQYCLANRLYKENFLKKIVSRWLQFSKLKIIHSRKYSDISRKISKNHKKYLTETIFNCWIQRLKEKIGKQQKVLKFRKKIVMKFMKTILATMRAYKDNSKIKTETVKKARVKEQGNIKKQIFKSFALFKEKAQIKKERLNRALHFRNFVLIKKMFKSMCVYTQSVLKGYQKFSDLVNSKKLLEKNKRLKEIKEDTLHKYKVNELKYEFQSSQTIKILGKSLKLLNLNSSTKKSFKNRKELSEKHYNSSLLYKYFIRIFNFSSSCKERKLQCQAPLEDIFAMLERSQKFSTFSLLKSLYVSSQIKLHQAFESIQYSILSRLFIAWHSVAQYRISNSQKLIKAKKVRARILKKGVFSAWGKIHELKILGKKLAINHEYQRLENFFRLWKIEMRIKEIEARREQKYKVYAFAGLQIYAEKTYQAMSHLKRVNIYETFKFMKKVVAEWHKYAEIKVKSRKVLLDYKKKNLRYVMNALKNCYYRSLISLEVYERCQKNALGRFLRNWHKALKRRQKGKKILGKRLEEKALLIKFEYFARWKPSSVHSSLEKTRIKNEYEEFITRKSADEAEKLKAAEEHYECYLISKSFYAWDNSISEHSIKRKRAFMHSIFMGWKIVTRENSLLRKYLIESNLSERYLRSSREIQGISTLKSVSSIGSLTSNS